MAIAPGSLGFAQLTSSPAAPPVGYCIIYSKTDNVVYLKDSSGTEIPLGTASGITSLTGEATGTGPGAATVTLSNSAVIGKVLTGFSAGPNSAVTATDTLLQAIQKLQAQISASGAISALTGDVSATGPGSVTATVNTVGGKTASTIATSVNDTQAATSTNTSSTIVKRDASGNFSANTITASLNGNATTATTATNFSGSLSGDVTGTQSATAVATVGTKTAAQINTSVNDTIAATASNTASTIVKRDASGNFSANTITANLTGTASGNEPPITPTTAADYYRGDKTFQPLNAAAIPDFNEAAQDAVGNILVDSSSVDFTYNDVANTITAAVLPAGVDHNSLQNFVANKHIDHSTVNISAGSGLTGGGDITVSRTISMPNVGTPGTYGSATETSVITTDTQGRVSAATTTTIAIPSTQVTDFTEAAQDAVGSILTDTATIDFTYDDAGNQITADVKNNSITDAKLTTGINANKISSGIVSNTEFDFLDGVTSNIQTQINSITGSGVTSLTGDVTGTGPGATATTVVTVGGKSASAIATSVDETQAATNLNTASTIVKRDASGNFSAGTITANLTGNVNGVDPAAHASRHLPSGADPLTTAIAITLNANSVNAVGTNNSLARSDHSHDLDTGVVITQTPDQTNAEGTSANLARADHRHNIPSDVPVQIGTINLQGAAASFALSDHVHAHGNQTNQSLHALATGSVHGFLSSSDKTKLDNATASNTASTLVLRDSSGNFSAGTITAALTGNVTGNLTGNVTGNVTGSSASFTGNLVGDVTGTQGATVVSLVGGKSAAQVSTSVDDTIAATSANTASTIVKRDSNGDISVRDINVRKVIPTQVTLTDGATINIDAALGSKFIVTIAGNRTIAAPTNPTTAQKITIRIRQDATGNRTVTWNAAFNFGVDLGGIPLSTTPNTFDYFGFEYNEVTAKWDCLAISRGYA